LTDTRRRYPEGKKGLFGFYPDVKHQTRGEPVVVKPEVKKSEPKTPENKVLGAMRGKFGNLHLAVRRHGRGKRLSLRGQERETAGGKRVVPDKPFSLERGEEKGT